MKIGLLCGRELSFPPAFIDRVNDLGRAEGITAEFVSLGGTPISEPARYRVIVDRISHEVAYYRGYLKHAVLQGTYVINNPFWWSTDDKFFNTSLAQKLGVAVPKTGRLPQNSDPRERRYLVEHEYLTPELGARVVRDAQTINRALGYEMNTVEFAIRDGIPYAIDFLNAAPDFERERITEFYFERVVDKMARLVIDRALRGTPADSWPRWEEMLGLGEAAGFVGAR